jgi:hypothetical protein
VGAEEPVRLGHVHIDQPVHGRHAPASPHRRGDQPAAGREWLHLYLARAVDSHDGGVPDRVRVVVASHIQPMEGFPVVMQLLLLFPVLFGPGPVSAQRPARLAAVELATITLSIAGQLELRGAGRLRPLPGRSRGLGAYGVYSLAE